MLSKKVSQAINEQINAEMYSSYLYLAMAAYFEANNLPGFGKWMHVQAKEEHGHAMKFYKYVYDRLDRVTLKAIAAPPSEWKSPLAAFQEVLKHERKVTGLIHKLAELAEGEKDYATSVLLQWFITEQVEEEANADALVHKLTAIKDSANGLLMLDHQLGKRGAE
jgi:ferritin